MQLLSLKTAFRSPRRKAINEVEAHWFSRGWQKKNMAYKMKYFYWVLKIKIIHPYFQLQLQQFQMVPQSRQQAQAQLLEQQPLQ